MTRGQQSAVTLALPIALVCVLAVIWMLPLAWPPLVAALVAIASLVSAYVWFVGEPLARPPAANHTSTAAMLCLSGIGLIALAYGGFALAHAEAFPALTRLGYPFLIATRLNLRGGLGLLLLCGLVSIVPLLFRRE